MDPAVWKQKQITRLNGWAYREWRRLFHKRQNGRQYKSLRENIQYNSVLWNYVSHFACARLFVPEAGTDARIPRVLTTTISHAPIKHLFLQSRTLYVAYRLRVGALT